MWSPEGFSSIKNSEESKVLPYCFFFFFLIFYFISVYAAAAAAAAAKSLQLCPTLCDPIDSSPPGSSVSGILQARILEWVAISLD